MNPLLSVTSQPLKRGFASLPSLATKTSVRLYTGGFSRFTPSSAALRLRGCNRGVSSFSPMDWWRNRQIKKQDEKFKDRIFEMAELPVWTVKHMQKDIIDATSSWTAKVPGLNSSKEIQQAKVMETVFKGLISVVGEDADEQRLMNMDQTEKLKAAVAGETTVEDINRVVHQFQVTSLMHKVIRKRKVEGRTIPTTQEGIQSAVQVDAPLLLTKTQRTKLGKEQARKMMRKRR